MTTHPPQRSAEPPVARRGGRRLRRSLIALVLLTALGGAWLAFGSGQPVPEVPVRRGDLVIGVEVTGTLEAEESVALGPPQLRHMWNFKIAMILPEGVEVHQGQPVIRFDTSELEQDLRSKLAERDSAEQEIEKERTSLERERRDTELSLAEAEAELRKARLKVEVPPELSQAQELELAKIDLELAQKKVAHLRRKLELQKQRGRTRMTSLREKRDRAAARVEEIQDQIRRMTVTAPRAGTVIQVTDRFGDQKKKVGDSVWRMEKVVEIPDLRNLRAQGEVDEADAGRLAEGQRVTFRLDAHTDVEYGGTVRRIHRTVQRRSPVLPAKVVRLEIDLDKTDPQRMRPGMRFRGKVEVARREDVLLAPAEAMFNTPQGPAAYTHGWLGTRRVLPEIGARNDSQVEILAGLREGDRLLTRPPEPEEREGR
jgi:HlyD family secretion protein